MDARPPAGRRRGGSPARRDRSRPVRSEPGGVVAFLKTPAAYPHPVDAVEHRQTHISHLFFAGDYVYKVKKPVDLGFLDFTTLAKRKAACEAEVTLNRRIAPDVYLGVEAIRRADDGLAFGGGGEVVEYAVKLRRLPAEWRLADAVDRGTVSADTLRRLGRRIAEFHRRAETSPAIARFGSLEVIGGNWRENFEQTQAYVGRTIREEEWRETRREVEWAMRAHAALFDRRVREGRIRDCHGDLLPEDIFVDPETGDIHVLDCIEFNERFRYSDTVADVAFVSMDLRNRGRDDLAEALLEAYFRASDDERHPLLMSFYECYRAYVRGKVRSFVIDQGEPSEEERRQAAAEAARYFRLAHEMARRIRPRLVLVAGLMGSGKSTLATNLGRRAKASVVQSDRVRKALAGLAPETPQRVGFGEGIYAPEWTERTYAAMLDEARGALADGRSVILDGSWSKAELRAAARAAAEAHEALFVLVECVVPELVLRRRLARRRPGTRPTDGRLEILDAQRAGYEPPAADEADCYLRVDTSGDSKALATRVYAEAFS